MSKKLALYSRVECPPNVVKEEMRANVSYVRRKGMRNRYIVVMQRSANETTKLQLEM